MNLSLKERKNTSQLLSLKVKNDYPVNSVNHVKNKVKRCFNIGNNVWSSSSQPLPKFASFPYLKNVSETVSRLLQHFNVRLAHKPSMPLKNSLCNFKINYFLFIKQELYMNFHAMIVRQLTFAKLEVYLKIG